MKYQQPYPSKNRELLLVELTKLQCNWHRASGFLASVPFTWFFAFCDNNLNKDYFHISSGSHFSSGNHENIPVLSEFKECPSLQTAVTSIMVHYSFLATS